MQLVVFSMVLILPALLKEGLLSGIEFQGNCMDIIEEYGNLSCRLQGSGDLENVDPHSCTLECSGNGRTEG
uniref:Putative secreted protein n=1 Tax=Ixodes ricinus TaxID=34613 RepID=V5H2X8_IXORI